MANQLESLNAGVAASVDPLRHRAGAGLIATENPGRSCVRSRASARPAARRSRLPDRGVRRGVAGAHARRRPRVLPPEQPHHRAGQPRRRGPAGPVRARGRAHGPVLPDFRLDSGHRVGVDIRLGKTDAKSTDELVHRYGYIASQPEGQIAKVQDALVDMALAALLRGAVVGLVPILVWLVHGARAVAASSYASARGPRRCAGGPRWSLLLGLLLWEPWTSDEPAVEAERSWTTARPASSAPRCRCPTRPAGSRCAATSPPPRPGGSSRARSTPTTRARGSTPPRRDEAAAAPAPHAPEGGDRRGAGLGPARQHRHGPRRPRHRRRRRGDGGLRRRRRHLVGQGLGGVLPGLRHRRLRGRGPLGHRRQPRPRPVRARATSPTTAGRCSTARWSTGRPGPRCWASTTRGPAAWAAGATRPG